MQDTAEGFGQPIRHIFQPFFRIGASCPRRSSARRTTGSRSTIGFWHGAVPCRSAGLVQRAATAVAWLQQGRIATYLLYSFLTLIVLLAVVL